MRLGNQGSRQSATESGVLLETNQFLVVLAEEAADIAGVTPGPMFRGTRSEGSGSTFGVFDCWRSCASEPSAAASSARS